MPIMPDLKGNARRAHEAIELAKLAVLIARHKAQVAIDPEHCLEEAFDLVMAAGRLIDRKELEQYEKLKK